MKSTKVLTLGLLGLSSVVALTSCGSKKSGYADLPTIDFIFNTNSGNQAIAENVQAQLKSYGIKMRISQDQWSTFLQTRKKGDYTCARNGWLADYNDPISFLDMWVTGSGNNDCQLGKGDHADSYKYEIDLSGIGDYTKLSGTWAQTYDVLISYIKKEQNTTNRYKLMHKAETLLMSTGCITPIYNYTDNWLQNTKLTDVYAAPLGYKYFTWAKNETGKELKAVLASKPDQIDPALNTTVDGGSYDVHLFSGLVRYTPTADKTGIELTPDLIKEFGTPTIAADGKATYTFTLRDGIKFSNGEAITAQDVVDSWNRAASYSVEGSSITNALDADYGYMFECIDGYDSLTSTSTNEDVKKFLNVKATSDNTLTVTTVQEYPYFKELLAFPAYAVLHDAWSLDKEGAWAKANTAVTSGAYKISSYNESGLVCEKNANYWDQANTTTSKITFAFSDDDSQMLGGYTNQEYLLIDSMSKETVTQYKDKAEYHVIGTLGTYYYSWNVNAEMFADMSQEQAQDVRNAISLLINRQYIVTSVTGTGETVSTGFVGAGLSDPAGGEFVDHNGVNEDGSGWTGSKTDYSANVTAAKTILDKYYKYY
jgi:oligopeptide transport system substrate-binding protein